MQKDSIYAFSVMSLYFSAECMIMSYSLWLLPCYWVRPFGTSGEYDRPCTTPLALLPLPLSPPATSSCILGYRLVFTSTSTYFAQTFIVHPFVFRHQVASQFSKIVSRCMLLFELSFFFPFTLRTCFFRLKGYWPRKIVGSFSFFLHDKDSFFDLLSAHTTWNDGISILKAPCNYTVVLLIWFSCDKVSPWQCSLWLWSQAC